jgi:S1-C subfamily serine protease
VGDVIVAAAGRVTMTVDDLTRIVSIAPKGEPLELSIVRDERLRELTIAA